MVPLVGCSLRHFLPLPLKFGIRWDILWPNPPLGHEIETLARVEDTSVCSWPHPPCLCNADGRNPECPQLDHEQYGRVGVQLAGGHVGSTPGISTLAFHLPGFLMP